jgi:hypothetical protein
MTSPTNMPDKVYYDLVISNLNGNLKGNSAPSLIYNETRSTPIIYDPSSYYMSIVRFSLDTATLPIFLPEIQIQDDPNLTAYSFTLSWTDPVSGLTYDAQEFMKFIPQDETRDVPLPPTKTVSGFQDNSSGYYFVYNYQYVIFLMNNTFNSCIASLQKKLPPGVKLPSINPPVMAWNTDNDRAILYTDILGYDVTNTNNMKIFMNSNMTQLWNSFPLKIVSYSNAGDQGKNTQIITNSFGYANVIPFPSIGPSYNAITVYQEYSTIASFNPVTSIVFTSNTLPVVPENISKPILLLNGNSLTSTGNNNQIANVITDLQLDSSYKPNILYNPVGQYRLISLVGTRPLIDIDVSVFWRDRFGSLNNFHLGAGSTCCLKFLFTKKTSE